MFSPASRWALSWSVVFGLCQQVPAGQIVTSSRPMDQACDRSIRIFVRALTPALLQIGGLRGASELGCINRCPRTQTTGGGSVGYSTRVRRVLVQGAAGAAWQVPAVRPCRVPLRGGTGCVPGTLMSRDRKRGCRTALATALFSTRPAPPGLPRAEICEPRIKLRI
jgi:hypothetical protein